MLFKHGTFNSAGGLRLEWKIECDTLDDEDWITISGMVAKRVPKFKKAIGVPTGGERFAHFLNLFASGDDADMVLIVDDVLTTGASMEAMREKLGFAANSSKKMGIVLFSRLRRKNVPEWIMPVFQLEIA